MSNLTTKQMLDLIVKNQERLEAKQDELAKEQFDFSVKVSHQMNMLTEKTNEICKLLEDNPKTSQKGMVSTQLLQEARIKALEAYNLENKGKLWGIGITLTIAWTMLSVWINKHI